MLAASAGHTRDLKLTKRPWGFLASAGQGDLQLSPEPQDLLASSAGKDHHQLIPGSLDLLASAGDGTPVNSQALKLPS